MGKLTIGDAFSSTAEKVTRVGSLPTPTVLKPAKVSPDCVEEEMPSPPAAAPQIVKDWILK